MAHAFQIDTLAFSKRLRAAGADEKLAEAIVEGITGADTSELATKADIAEVNAALKADIAEVRNELKADIAEVNDEIKDVRTELKADIAEVRSDLKWMRLIGAGILVTLVWQIVQQSFGL